MQRRSRKNPKLRSLSSSMALTVPPAIATAILALSLFVAGGLYSTLSVLVRCPNDDKIGPDKLLREQLGTLPPNEVGANDTSSGTVSLLPKSHPHNSIFELSMPIDLLKPDVKKDDDLLGKSCRFEKQSRVWQCRDCGLGQDGSFSDWTDCPVLGRNHICGDLTNNNDYDVPQPRKYTYLDPLSTETRNIISHFIQESKHFEQIACDERMDDCWDFSKCPSDGAMTIYVHHNGVNPQKNRAKRYVDMASERYPGAIQVTTDPSKACLNVVACDAYQNFSELSQSSNWNEGRNHFIWEANRCFDSLADRPFDYRSGIHYARASLASSSFQDANIRKGYDIALARTKSFHISNETYSNVLDSMGQQRQWLVAFKGNVYTDWSHVWWTHRWMAAEYWEKDDSEVAIDVTCDLKPNYTSEYDYVELLSNSTFAFCPGGGATQSFRFTEALGLGAIPVTTADLLPPFAYDLDWSGCVVQISEARVVDLPRILRQIPREEIVQRQQRCQVLFQKTVGWRPLFGSWKIDTDRTLFMTSLKIWAWRIQKYHTAKQAEKDLEDGLFVVSKEAMLHEW